MIAKPKSVPVLDLLLLAALLVSPYLRPYPAWLVALLFGASLRYGWHASAHFGHRDYPRCALYTVAALLIALYAGLSPRVPQPQPPAPESAAADCDAGTEQD